MILAAAMPLYAAMLAAGAEPASLVRPMMGTGAAGCVVPVAAAPFGMVQLGPDTYFTSSGYHYDHDVIYGFSHTHKSGGGGTDFQDIMFFPVADSAWQRLEVYPDRVGSRFSHEREHVEPGYYRGQAARLGHRGRADGDFPLWHAPGTLIRTARRGS